jgi:hypothetical protein
MLFMIFSSAFVAPHRQKQDQTENRGAYSVQLFNTTRAPSRSVIRALGQRATAAQ